MNFRAILVAAAAIAVADAVLTPSARPARAERPSTCQQTHLRDGFVAAELPPKAQVEVLVAAGVTAAPRQKDAFAQMARALFVCAGTDATIDLVPITDTGYGRGPIFTATAPGPHPGRTNRLIIQKQQDELERRAGVAIHTVLFTPEKFTGSDILGTLYTAGNALHDSQATKRVVIIIANGWHQTHDIDLFTYKRPPDTIVGDVVKKLRKQHRMPNLADTDVYVVGISRGADGMRIDEGGLASLCTFWNTVVEESHGTMPPNSCGRMLPGMPEQLATPPPS